jgi:hypothetical protein
MAGLPDLTTLLEGLGSSTVALAAVAALVLVSLFLSKLFLGRRPRRVRPFRYSEDHRVASSRPLPPRPMGDEARGPELGARLEWLGSVLDEIRQEEGGPPPARIEELAGRVRRARAGLGRLEEEVPELESEILALLPPLEGER